MMSKKNYILSSILLLILVVNLGNLSAYLGAVKQDDCISLRANINATAVNTTIYYPNQTIAIQDAVMSQLNGNIWDYSFCNTSALGYYVYHYCDQNGGNCIENNFKTNVSGFDLTTANALVFISAIGFLIVISTLFFIAFMKTDSKPQYKWTFFLLCLIFFLSALNLLSIAINDSLLNTNVAGFFDSFTSMSFIIYWFAFGLLGVIWFLTILNTILFNKEIKRKQMYG